MKIIKLYTLLGFIKTGTQPYTIRFHSCNWKWDNECKDYYNIHYKKLFDGVLSGNLTSSLNDIVEILDDKEEPKGIPEKLDHLIGYDIRQFDDLKEYVEITTGDLFGKVNKIIDTLNQLLDYLESKGESNE